MLAQYNQHIKFYFNLCKGIKCLLILVEMHKDFRDVGISHNK